MKKRRIDIAFCAAFLFAAVLALAGCATLKALEERVSAPVGGEGALMTSLRARAVVSMVGVDGKVIEGKAVVLAKRPDSFRIEFFGPLGLSTALVIGNGDKDGGLYIYRNGSSSRLRYDDKNPFYPLDGSAVVSVLFGVREGFNRLGENYEISIDEDGRVRSFVGCGPANGFFAKFDDFRPIGIGGELPFSIELSNRGERVLIRYASIEINPVFDKSVFSTDAGLP